MRYSMLVHLNKMARTLQEAALYIDTAPDEDPVCPELLSNGVKMLEQIRGAVEQHRDDLYDPVLLEHLSAVEALWEEGGDALQGALEAFAQALPNSISYQVRAVFFTGLGSTWDAMQSVYEYMRDDLRFDPVVVLIPVFRRVQQDGQMKQETIYTDYLTPMGIPFLEYNQYSLEQDCPDLAFINQPYESVIPSEFWPENIAKHTRLVYLPYFMQDVYDEEDIVPLAKLPVYRYAWKVACQNQSRNKFYCKYAANGGSNNLLSGIPKMDPLVRLQRQGTALPCEWESIKGKTVFLWNTWYSIEISSIRYLPQILEWFQTNPDCVLLWRLHPMTDTVTKLYFLDEYLHYKKMYMNARKIENVIIDNNSSFHAAFYWSNALISDYSSLISQYLLMDKPALWIKSPLDRYVHAKSFIDNQWLEQTKTVDGVFNFLDCIRKGTDSNRELRKQIRERDLPLADGHCAERVSNAVWLAMHSEDGLHTKGCTGKDEYKCRLDETVSSS